MLNFLYLPRKLLVCVFNNLPVDFFKWLNVIHATDTALSFDRKIIQIYPWEVKKQSSFSAGIYIIKILKELANLNNFAAKILRSVY
jgi:hypothetical protein